LRPREISMEGDGKRSPVLEAPDTEALARRNQLVNDHLWLVKCIAHRLFARVPDGIDVDDLIGAGAIGLIKAADEYDPSRGVKFETYARHRIRGSMMDDLRKQDALPHSQRSKLREVERAIEELERKLGRYPADSEIAEKAGMSEEMISDLLASATSVDLYSLEAIFEKGDEGWLDSPEAQAQCPDPHSRMEHKEVEALLAAAIGELPRTDRLVLSLYYYHGLRMKEVGFVLNLTESRVSQIHARAILLLRGRLRILVNQ
jgi:RNA polymerase sigma factor for flagellar operon FliA